MEPQSTPPGTPPPKRPYKNGVDHGSGKQRGVFAPRSWSFLWRAKLEALVAFLVIAGVVGVFVYLVQIPGALIVRVMDEGHKPVIEAHARCRHPGAKLEMAGFTDVFGEAKFPGLERGQWTCEVDPPDRFFSPTLTGFAEVRPRRPAILELTAHRGADVEVQIVRPAGGPRAAVAVRAVCPAEQGEAATGWQARAGLMDGSAFVYLPRGRRCRIGLLKNESGPLYTVPERMTLDCEAMPCSEPLIGKSGEHLSAKLHPTREQWEAARPPPEADPVKDGGVK
jgi:hypothetical protein